MFCKYCRVNGRIKYEAIVFCRQSITIDLHLKHFVTE